MKLLFCLAITAFLVFTLSSCSSQGKEKPLGGDGAFNSFIQGDEYDSCYLVSISMENLEMTSSMGHKYVFSGNVVLEDYGVCPETVKELLETHTLNNESFPALINELILTFTGAKPKSVTCYYHYYSDMNGNLIYQSLQQIHSVENADDAVVLPIGTDHAVVLNSNHSEQKDHFRIIRIVCEFDDNLVEYYIYG